MNLLPRGGIEFRSRRKQRGSFLLTGMIMFILLTILPMRSFAYTPLLKDNSLINQQFHRFFYLHSQLNRTVNQHRFVAHGSLWGNGLNILARSMTYWWIQTAQHEIAHYQYAHRRGWNPSLHFSAFSGEVLISSPTWSGIETEQKAQFSAAGLNSIEFMAPKFDDPLARLIGRFQNTLYLLNGPHQYHDAETWRSAMKTRMDAVPSREEMFYHSLAVDLLNPHTWGDLGMLWSFLRNGSQAEANSAEMWEGVPVPELSYFLSSRGELIGAEFHSQNTGWEMSFTVARGLQRDHWKFFINLHP